MDYALEYACARTAAADALSGNMKHKNQALNVAIKKNRKHQKLIFLFLIPFIYFLSFFLRPCVSGHVVSANYKDGILKNTQITFFETKTKTEYPVCTNKKGEFNIRIPSGNYKIYGSDLKINEKYRNPESSFLNLEITENRNLRVTVKK